MPNSYTAKVGYQDGSYQWEEELAVPDGLDPETYIQAIIEDYNRLESRRYGDKAKEFIV